MDPRVNTKAIGAAVVGILAVIITILFVVHKNRYEQCSEVFRIYFERPVTGLRKGDSVVYNGINAGRVKDIKPDTTNLRRVLVTVCLEQGFPVKTDSFAMIETKSITGGLLVSIDPGSMEAHILKPSGGEIPVIQSRASNMDKLMDSMPKILTSVEKTFNQVSNALSKETLDNLNKTIERLSNMVEKVDTLLRTNEHGINVLLSEGTVHLNELLTQGVSTFKKIEAAIDALNHSPRRFLYKDASDGFRPQ